MDETKYIINRWYDDRNANDPYSFELLNTEEYTGKVGDIITVDDIEDMSTDMYFEARNNLPLTLTSNETRNVIDIK